MTVYREDHDAIEGERIVCQYSKITGNTQIHDSESHRGTQSTLYDAYCVITKPLRTTQYKK